MSDPFKPKLTGKVRIGGIVSRATHPAAKNGALNGGPQMVEVSRDGRRVYFTNSLYGAIDGQFYPDGVKGWMVKLNAKPEGGMAFDERFFVEWPKSHQRTRCGSKAVTARRTAIAIRNPLGIRLGARGRMRIGDGGVLALDGSRGARGPDRAQE